MFLKLISFASTYCSPGSPMHPCVCMWSLGEIVLTSETPTGSVEQSLWSGGGAVASLVWQGEGSWVFTDFIPNRRGEEGSFLDGSWKAQLRVSLPSLPLSSSVLGSSWSGGDFWGNGIVGRNKLARLYVTDWIFWHVPCDFRTLLTPITGDCFSFLWQKCEAVESAVNKAVPWKWKLAGLLKVCFV